MAAPPSRNPPFSARARGIDASGIRKVFDLAAQLKDPINLSIGQPHYPVPDAIKAATAAAIAEDRNAYSPSQGIAPLVARLQAMTEETYGHSDRRAFVTSGTSGGLMLALARWSTRGTRSSASTRTS